MDQIPLVSEQIEGGRKVIERLVANGIAVEAAGWVKECDLWQWYLYLVTPLVGEGGATTPAYRRILDVLRAGPQPPEVDFFEIKVVGPSQRVGRAILDAARRGGRPWGYGGASLGEKYIDGAYFYPPLIPAATQDAGNHR